MHSVTAFLAKAVTAGICNTKVMYTYRPLAARPWLIRWWHNRAVLCGWSMNHSDSNGGPLWPVRGYNIELKNFKAPCLTGPKVSNLPKLCCIELLTVVPPPYGPATGGGLQGPISLEYQICPSHHTI